ncbi:MAG: patatin-like phospholipase family protein [Clostridia bacterium]|nr:patatin-like phospholipase family protein [Clostridia bacterium]
MNGVFLQGGGAKGAFQAGVICALHDRGVVFDVISGTSIGAINGYFLLKGAYDEMKHAWLTKSFSQEGVDIDSPIIESSGALEVLSGVREDACDPSVQHFYVNFVPVVEQRLHHQWADLVPLSEEERFEIIRHSSLLPKGIGEDPFDGNYNLQQATERFKTDLKDGLYDDYKLDGGLLNNAFLEPFEENKMDKLYLIVFKTTFEVPKYIIERYDEHEICLIASDIQYEKTDTLNFDENFLRGNFERGYAIGSDVSIE